MAYCKSIIYGTRSIVYAKLGLTDIALSWANETLKSTQNLQLEMSHMSRIALIYAVAASLHSGNTSIYESFINSSGHLKEQWALFSVLHTCLQEFQKLASIPQSTPMTLLSNNQKNNPEQQMLYGSSNPLKMNQSVRQTPDQNPIHPIQNGVTTASAQYQYDPSKNMYI